MITKELSLPTPISFPCPYTCNVAILSPDLFSQVLVSVPSYYITCAQIHAPLPLKDAGQNGKEELRRRRRMGHITRQLAGPTLGEEFSLHVHKYRKLT